MAFNFFKKKKEKEEAEFVNVYFKYSYEWNDDIPIEERDTTEHPSRPFCKKMIELNRVYTRQEIESISAMVGYSVWDRKGGEGCRHRWVKQTIFKKIK
jgi:hypothetical protein